MPFNSTSPIQDSSDVDHQETTSRTHDGDSITPTSVDTDSLDRADTLIDQGTSWCHAGSHSTISNPDDTSSSSYTRITSIDDSVGGVTMDRIPAGAELYGYFVVRVDSVPAGETANYRPQVRTLTSTGGSTEPMNELELTATDSRNNDRVRSGWTEITTIDASSVKLTAWFATQAKVTGGTLSTNLSRDINLQFHWRVD